MKWLFIIDPLEKLNPATDTTYAMMEESSSRNINIFVAEASDLFFDKKVKACASEINFPAGRYSAAKKSILELDDFQITFMRKEPPYDIGFHYSTALLSLSKKIVVNSPRALRDFNEKLIILNFPMIIPKTIVTSIENEIVRFVKANSNAVLKSLDSYQGNFVCKINSNDKKLKSSISRMTMNGAMPVMVQEFLPAVYKGDKRILMLNGKIIGAVKRIPKKGSFLSNFGQGGSGIKTNITKIDKRIADSVSEFLVRNGIHFAGLDVIDGHLTEINITCPTGVKQINAIENRKLETVIVDYFKKLAG